MKFSERWLREWVSPDLTTQELVHQLTMAGLEVDSCVEVAGNLEGLVVGEVIEVSDHPNADSLHLCKVVAGGPGPVPVVCGAPNVHVRMKAAFAPVGASLDGNAIKQVKLRGEVSMGMLCSERELGISDDHSGLLELPSSAEPGADLIEYLGLRDHTIDLDLTPNRSDCLGIAGLAREVGVVNNLDVRVPVMEPVKPTIGDSFPVSIAAGKECPRYVGRVVRGIDLDAETPLWMRERLRRCGLRSIDPVVDVTNYVMLELGQPMHAFDLARLSGEVIVRLAREGESIRLLDDKELTLREGTLLITDRSGPIAVAGVMGGKGTAVSESTRDIFLESAFFTPLALSGVARSYALNTDASHRFERGVDHGIQVRAIERATELLLQIAGGEAGPVNEVVSSEHLPRSNEVRLRSERIRRVLGIEVSTAEVDELLARLALPFEKVEKDQSVTWTVRSPSHRFDIALEEDLIEEIGRIYGYHNVPSSLPSARLRMREEHEETLTLPEVRAVLAARGYFEAINYGFVDARLQDRLDPGSDALALANPLSAEQGVMRTTLWTGLVKSLIHNLNRQQERIRLFETGLRFLPPPNVQVLELATIRQEKMIAGVIYGPRYPESWGNAREKVDFFDLKSDLEAIFRLTRAPGAFVFAPGSHPALHPGQTAEIRRDGALVGYAGMLHPGLRQQIGIPDPVFLFELRWEMLREGARPTYRELSRYPEIRRDIALLVDAGVPADDLCAAIRESAGEHLQNLKLFDVYQGKGIDPNRKSLALGLTFQHGSRTLTDEEINESVDRVLAALRERFGASLRN